MKVYLASRYSRKTELRKYANKARKEGIKITSSWLREHNAPDAILSQISDKRNRDYALQDLKDIKRADTLVLFSENPLVGIPRGGRLTEFGYALALGKSIIVVGPRENTFMYMLEVTVVPTWEDALEIIK